MSCWASMHQHHNERRIMEQGGKSGSCTDGQGGMRVSWRYRFQHISVALTTRNISALWGTVFHWSLKHHHASKCPLWTPSLHTCSTFFFYGKLWLSWDTMPLWPVKLLETYSMWGREGLLRRLCNVLPTPRDIRGKAQTVYTGWQITNGTYHPINQKPSMNYQLLHNLTTSLPMRLWIIQDLGYLEAITTPHYVCYVK